MRHRFQAWRLGRSDDPVVAAIGEALKRGPSAEESECFRRIEAERERLAQSDAVLRTPLRDYTEDESHDHVFEDKLGDLVMRASKPADAAGFLFSLLRRLRPDSVVELGTALGISASYLGAALQLNGAGSLVTMDAAAERMVVAREVLRRLDLDDVVDTRLGRFQELLPELLDRQRVGVAFVDGQHEEEATLEYLELIQPALEFPGIVVFDDIAWSEGMKRAWGRLKSDERLTTAVELFGMGVCVYKR